MLSKKYYTQFADMIAEHKKYSEHPEQLDTIRSIQYDMIALFKADNPNFSEERFNTYIKNKVKQLSH